MYAELLKLNIYELHALQITSIIHFYHLLYWTLYKYSSFFQNSAFSAELSLVVLHLYWKVCSRTADDLQSVCVRHR